jgi:hypothetical protein
MRYKPSKSEIAVYGVAIENAYNDTVNDSRIVRDPKKFKLSLPVTREAIVRFLSHKDLIEDYHPGLNGSDEFKIAGYLTYWISKLKPVMILGADPDENERLINEYLAINFAVSFIYDRKNVLMTLSKKLLQDLTYSLRYRTLTVRMLPIIYEAYLVGYRGGIDKTNETYMKVFDK